MPSIDRIRVNNIDYDIENTLLDNFSETETRIGSWINRKTII